MAFWVETEDWHTAGEPFRIVSQLPSGHSTTGTSVAQRRQNIVSQPGHPLDTLRKSLCLEPRGHDGMYGGFIVPPDSLEAHLGVLFWHKDGFSTACGHGSIALGYWAIASGLVQGPEGGEGSKEVVIDTPSGRVKVLMTFENGKAVHADYISVPAFVVKQKVPLRIRGKDVKVDLAFAGALYASVAAEDMDVPVEPACTRQLIDLAKEIKVALGDHGRHCEYNLYGVMIHTSLEVDDKRIRQKSITVFADGQVDRSPCGSGTASRVATLVAQGHMDKDTVFEHESIIGSTFEASIRSMEARSPTAWPACVPRIRGSAHLTGRHRFYIDPDSPIFPGYVLG